MDIKRSNITRPLGQTTPLATTQSTPSPAVTAVDAVVDTKSAAIDGVDAVVQSSTIKQLDQLWASKQYGKIVDVIAAEVAPLLQADFKGLDGNSLVAATSKVYVLEERLKATLNQLSMTDAGPAKMQALGLAKDLATVSTAIFRQAVVLQDRNDTRPVTAWIVAKDTHKNAHKWSPEEHLAYVAQKTVEFYIKGGQESQIRSVDGDFLKSLKSGALCEYVVDAYDVARAAVVEEGRPSPGHTVLSQGNDAFSAGTFEVQKDARGDITQVLIGTFSGHYRTGLDVQEHLARHVVAGLTQLYPNKSPAELVAMVVRREGQATNPRTIEVIGRGIGLEGAHAQQLETALKAEAMRWQPLQLLQAGPKGPGSALGKELAGIKDWVVGAINDGLFLDEGKRAPNLAAPLVNPQQFPKAELVGATSSRRSGAATDVLQVLARIDAFMEKAVVSGDSVVGQQLIGTLSALNEYAKQLPAGAVNGAAKAEIERLAARWNNGVAGKTGADLGLVFSSPPTADRTTRIVATVNPKATDDQLKDMLRAGMDVARFNTAHGSLDEKIGVMKKLRLFAAEMGKDVTIQVDLEGPKLRLRKFDNPQKLANNDIWLKTGETATLTTKDILGSQQGMLFPVDYPTLCDDVKPGDPVSMNDATVKLVVKAVDKAAGSITCEVITGGKVWDNKGVAFPQSKLSGNTVTDEDVQNLTALIDHVDVFAQSFVQDASDVIFLRERMADLGQVKPVIAKIERGNIALNEDALLKIALAADGLMVARGDLGVELGEAKLPVAERLIREVGEKTGRPVMLATEVMMSVLSESRASRGDVDALYGAVTERRFHAIMLGKETSAHKNPGDVIREVSGYISFGEQERDKPKAKPQPTLGRTTAAALFVSRGQSALKPTRTATTSENT
jgi:pyruvate kinase